MDKLFVLSEKQVATLIHEWCIHNKHISCLKYLYIYNIYNALAYAINCTVERINSNRAVC